MWSISALVALLYTTHVDDANSCFWQMTDSTFKMKSQHFWGEAEINAMLAILREMDTIKFLES